MLTSLLDYDFSLMVSNGKISLSCSLESTAYLRFVRIILCISLRTGRYVGVIHFCLDGVLDVLTWFSLILRTKVS